MTTKHLLSGIDLASPSELVAHERDRFDIAKHIGAEEVIYQDLADLKFCCASLSPRKDQDFEVGVFCGKYITSVPDGYFEHLEDLRGKARSSAPAASLSTQVASSGATAQERSSGETLNGGISEPLRSPADREDIRYVKPVQLDLTSIPTNINISIYNIANNTQSR